MEWPPRSPDLKSPDFILREYLKGKAYTNKQLKDNIFVSHNLKYHRKFTKMRWMIMPSKETVFFAPGGGEH